MIKKALLASLALGLTSMNALADSTSGKILAYDRKAQLIVLEDKTVWSLDGSEAAAPDALKAGDEVEIDFESEGEDGISKIESIKLLSQ